MKTSTIIWTILLVVGGAWIAYRASVGPGMGKAYVKDVRKDFVFVEVPPPIGADSEEKPVKQWVPAATAEARGLDRSGAPQIVWESYDNVDPKDYEKAVQVNPNQTTYQLSMPRTLGIWIAAFFTLAIFSFLYKDNPFYKLAESILVGVSAAYWMVVAFWDVIVPNLIGKLSPALVRMWALPGLEDQRELLYIVPLVLGIMLLWRLMPAAGWISRWPLAFIIGTTAGLRLVAHIQSDFIQQIRNTIIPLWVKVPQLAPDGTVLLDAAGKPLLGFDPWDSLANIIIVVGMLACLVYFFFSFEHKGVVGKIARVGIWFLMITFGAGFGYTVMGRITLLAGRLEFLFDDWLWLIDPLSKRLTDG
jgi:hypothetical protein